MSSSASRRPTVDLLGPAPAEGCRTSPKAQLPNFVVGKTRFCVFAQRGRCVVTRLLQPTEARRFREESLTHS